MEPDVCRKFVEKDPSLQLLTYDDEEKKHLHAIIDLVIVCGGDGTMLHAASQFPTAVPPMLAFNTGSIGFLTSFATLSNFKSVLENVFTGRTFLSIRMRLTCRVNREQNAAQSSAAGQQPCQQLPSSERYQVLNEVVIDRGVSPFLTSLEMYCNDSMVTTVAADGIIAASPTGSTAYNMSAGGSMVHPDVPSILLTPICPHSLSFRPIVLPDTVSLKFRVSEKSRATAWVSFDGKFRQELRRGESVEIQTSVWPVPVICSEYNTQDWFKTLSTLLHWNTRHIQKELQNYPEDGEEGNDHDNQA
jgi:NAD+ kinase